MRRGELRHAPNLRWHDVPFGSRWSQRFGLPVIVENNANAGAVGEYYFGAAQRGALYLGGGTGIGGGMISGRAHLPGARRLCRRDGHMTIEAEGELAVADAAAVGRRWQGRAVVAKYRSRMEPSVRRRAARRR